MNAEAFTLKARRTTRVPLRVPVQLSVEEAGVARALDGWTVIVNIHGAKIESKRRMQVGETVKVTVPLTRKTQSGKVVWSSETATAAGYIEFALELTEPGNLWGVGFPPSDWKEVRAVAGPVAVESKPAAPAASTPSVPPAQNKPAPKKISVAGYQPQPIAPFTVNKAGGQAAPAVQQPVAAATLSQPPAPATAPEVSESSPAPAQAAMEQSMAEPPAALPELPLEPLSIGLMTPKEASAPQPEVAVVQPEGEPQEVFSKELEQWMNLRGGAPAPQPEPPLAELLVGPAEAVSATSKASSEAPEMLNVSESAAVAPELPAEPQMVAPLVEVNAGELVLETPEAVDTGRVIEHTMKAAAALELAPSLVEIVEPESIIAMELETPLAAEAIPAALATPILEVSTPRIPTAATSTPAITIPAATVTASAAQQSGQSFAALTEMAATAFQTRIDGILDRAGAALEARLGEMESGILERIDKKLTAAAEDHYERLDQHSESLAAARRLEFEQGLTKFAEASDAAARHRQQEMNSRAEQDLRRRANEIALHAQGQVQRYSSEALEAAQSNMAAKLQDLLPAIEQVQRQATEAVEGAQAALQSRLKDLLPGIEQEVAENSRRQAEQIHYLQRGQFEAAMSARIEEARSYWYEQLETMQQEASNRLSESLEKCMEQQHRVLLQQMERALTQMAAQVQKTFFKHVVDELASQQQVWMEQASRNLEALTGQGVRQVREQMVRVLGAMGAALLQDEVAAEEAYSNSEQQEMQLEA